MIIGIGIDIVDIDRINSLLQRYGMRFLRKIFSPDEVSYCMKRYDPATCLAGRFAAKEAAFKALSAGKFYGIPFKDISVCIMNGVPHLNLTGKAQEISHLIGAVRHHVSIAHDKGCAVAIVVLESA
ncbi:MAG TPA: holo-ACP synthase [Desulfomonilia bacterium]|nr:holo-ACP synthase [Desulfomonilia bacterium]